VLFRSRSLGIHGTDLEDLHYAALFHDVGRSGHESPRADMTGAASSASILANVGFLSKAVPILEVLNEDEPSGSQSEGALVAAYVVARMSDIDDEMYVVPMIGPRPSERVGARLYAETRRGVDRAIRRVETLLRAGTLPMDSIGETLQ
jgi:hypothetical protein